MGTWLSVCLSHSLFFLLEAFYPLTSRKYYPQNLQICFSVGENTPLIPPHTQDEEKYQNHLLTVLCNSNSLTELRNFQQMEIEIAGSKHILD